MAFESVPGIRVTSKATGQTFIIGDYFAAVENSVTQIYNWCDIVAVTENEREFEIVTNTEPYFISKTAVPDIKVQLAIRTIIEGQIAVHPNIAHKYDKRILPIKSLYVNCDPSDDAYIATGAYSEKEINYSNVTLAAANIGKIIWIVFAAVAVLSFITANTFFGRFADNWLKFTAISVFGGGISAMFVYMIHAIVARNIYSRFFRYDASIVQPITFVVCEEGFAAVESDVYTFSDLIQWSQAPYFIETNYMFIIFNDKNTLFWLPKRLFPIETQNKLSDFISNHLLAG